MQTSDSFRVVIPARFQSTRLPGKPLKRICGKEMVLHVYEKAMQSEATEVVIATDDERIFKVAEDAGAVVCLTSSTHETGTDRLVEVMASRQWADETIIVNVQGDEPLIPVDCINQVANNLKENTDAVMATLATEISDHHDYNDPNVVKVVFNLKGLAMYFSRSAIPHYRDGGHNDGFYSYRHIGLYAYRAGYLRRYPKLKVSQLENVEKLEQLRVIDNGDPIHVGITRQIPGPGVDTPEQLDLVESIMVSESASQTKA